MRETFFLLSAVVMAILSVACGVKGPPLPPIPATPEQSEAWAPRAPAPSPLPKNSKN